MLKELITCDEKGCRMPATHGLTWDDIDYAYCQIHANEAVAIADAMEYTLPRETAHKLSDDELNQLWEDMRP